VARESRYARVTRYPMAQLIAEPRAHRERVLAAEMMETNMVNTASSN
jgi:hypothetical protein